MKSVESRPDTSGANETAKSMLSLGRAERVSGSAPGTMEKREFDVATSWTMRGRRPVLSSRTTLSVVSPGAMGTPIIERFSVPNANSTPRPVPTRRSVSGLSGPL